MVVGWANNLKFFKSSPAPILIKFKKILMWSFFVKIDKVKCSLHPTFHFPKSFGSALKVSTVVGKPTLVYIFRSLVVLYNFSLWLS